MALNYTEMFEAVKADIAEKREELGKLMARAERLEDEITGLQQTAAGLAKTLRQEFVAEDSIGLTEAMRRVYRTNPTRNYLPTEMRDALAEMGYDVRRFGNVLASIHAVTARLAQQGDIRHIGTRENKPVYQWCKGQSPHSSIGKDTRTEPKHTTLEKAVALSTPPSKGK